MRKYLFIVCVVCFKSVYSQQVYEQELEEQIESRAEREETTDDDMWMQQLQYFRKHPVDLNAANEEDLSQLQVLSALQIQQLLRYRTLLGPLIHVNELQAVPGWSPALIRKIIPFVTLSNQSSPASKLLSAFNKGNYSLLVRVSEKFNNSEEIDNAVYEGSPQYMQFRFKYRYGNLVQYGFVAEKDAGEKFFTRSGIDFYSFHLFLQHIRFVKRFVLGDFTIKMGQGLVQWQGMSNKKSSSVLFIKQQQEIINSYSSVGEIYFQRGAAFTLASGKWEFTSFISRRKLSAHIDRDSFGNAHISSFSTTGYHRTESELAQKNTVSRLVSGCNISFRSSLSHIGLNVVRQNFSLPIDKGNEPYQRFAGNGKYILNGSIDYSFTYQNVHGFGEFAVDRHFNKAWLSGILLTLDKRLDISLLFRSISPSYVCMDASAFTENSSPSNERGMYYGMRVALFPSCTLEGYVDFFLFPWLKYRVDAPSGGNDFFLQLAWQPSRKVEIFARYKMEMKEGNGESTNGLANVINNKRHSWRYQFKWELNKAITLANRLELSRYTSSQSEYGALSYIDLQFKSTRKPYRLSGRVQTFNTAGYDCRIYSLEKGVLFEYAIPAYSGKGWNYFLNVNYDFKRRARRYLFLRPTECWISWSQIFSTQTKLAFNLINAVPLKTKASISFQLLYSF